MKTLLATFAIAIVASAGSAFAGEFPDISLAELKEVIAKKEVVVIDVNGSKSYDKNHIPTAINFSANKDKLASLLPEDKGALVVAYCGSPQCSAYQSAANAAKELGYTNVKHFSGGIKGWLAAGEDTEAGTKG